jgi:serine/threonine protein kinase
MVSLMIEYMDGGSLEDIVDQGGCDDEPTLANIAIQALKGLSFLHSCGQIHRDLKPGFKICLSLFVALIFSIGNFLISHRGEVKVADLGIMKQLNMNTGAKKGLLPKTNTFVGTATYMSPERIDGKEYSFPSDVWAFGLSLVTIALGRLPIDTQGGYWTILHNIRDAPPPTLPADIFSADFRDFVGLCLKRNPDERHTCAQLLKHPFLHKVVAEDLTYDQNYDRGKNELLSILLAVFMHIKQIKANILEALSSCERSDVDLDAYRNHRLYGDLTAMSAIDILYKVLFGGEPQQPSKDSGGGLDKPGEYSRGSSRPRLTNLAKQLHLPIDKVVNEAKQYFEQLKREHHMTGN